MDEDQREFDPGVVCRSFTLAEIEFRESEDDGRVTFEGVASVVDRPYLVRDHLGEYTEVIKSGAFNKTLRDSKENVGLFIQHNWRFGGLPIADRESGTLELAASPDLKVRASLNPAHDDVRNLRTLMHDGIVREMSIGFSVPRGRSRYIAETNTREISEVKLMEASVVWDGANPLTTASMRSFVDLIRSTELDPDEIDRAITYLTSLRPATEERAEPETDPNAALRLALWQRRLPPA